MNAEKIKKLIRQGQDRNEEESVSTDDDTSYRAFGLASRKGCAFIKLVYKEGNISLLNYAHIGDVYLNYDPDSGGETLLIERTGKLLQVTGVNLKKALKLIQYRECEFFCELPDSADASIFTDDEPAIVSIRWLKMEKPSRT